MKKHAQKLARLAKTLLLILVALGIFSQSPASKSQKVSASDLNLLYQLDFSDETNIGKNMAGTLFPDATLQDGNSLTVEDAKVGKALNFPGNSRYLNYLSVPTAIFENQDAVTLSGWFYLPDGVSSYLGEFGIYSTDNDKSFRSDPYAEHFGNAYILCAGSPASINLDTKVKPVYDAWYHMAYVIDAENSLFAVYQNGALVLQSALEEGFSPADYYSPNSHFYIGQSSYEDNHDDYQGKMSDIRVYGAALTSQELVNEYDLFITDFITAEYTFDTEETLYRDNIRGYDLALYKNAPVFENGVMRLENGAAVQAFNKENNQNNKFFDGHANLTISMDLNIKTSPGDHWKRIMDMYIDDSYRITYMAYCPRIDDNNFFDIVYHRNQDYNLLSDDSFELPNQTWFNLTIVMDVEEIRVYQDEELKMTVQIDSELPTFSNFFYDLANSERGNFTIGSNSYEDNNWVSADYDNIRIYAAAARTKEEIQSVRAGFEYRYKIVYHANNETLATKVQYVDMSDTAHAITSSFTKDGFVFASWNTLADGSGTTYTEGELISLDADLELFAKWESNSYFVSFDANGGRGQMDDQIIARSASQNLKPNQFLKTGHLFAGWNTLADGSGDTYQDEDEITPNADVVLYAQWEPKTYQVSFNNNNGSGVMADQELRYGDLDKLNKNLFTRHGYLFAGWAYTSEGTKVFSDEEEITAILEGNDVELFAVWNLGEFTIKYNANGGEGSIDDLLATAFTFVNLKENDFTKSGYKFIGWALSADGDLKYEDAEKIALDDNLTLYAIWELGEFTISYHGNGGVGSMEDGNGTSFSKLNLSQNSFEKEGYKFIGWALSVDGDMVYEDGEEITLDEDLNLYALWEEVDEDNGDDPGDTEEPGDEDEKSYTGLIVAATLAVLLGVSSVVILVVRRRKA